MNVKSLAEICREYERTIISSGGGDESVSIEKLVTIREVQTPILSDTFGGAVAKPFLTEATRAYRGKQLALRIAPELWSKRLVIGGLGRVFEISAQFRNEGIDSTHNPEFTTCEFYQAYAGLEDIISMTEQLLSSLEVSELKSGKLKDLPPRDRNGLHGPLPKTRELLSLFETLYPHAPNANYPRLLDKLSSRYLEPQCIEPTFLRVSSELFVNGKGLVNAYEENSPTEQRRKFVMQAGWKDDDVTGGGEDGEEVDGHIAMTRVGLAADGWMGSVLIDWLWSSPGAERIAEVLAFGGLKGVVNLGDGVRSVNKEGE
ncbi:hypothetical protein B9Z19DRAFT_1119740 [Tuber borchii]|uniref:Aminoacyl-transfer RNA synthetases class-II family profile domain-containing protein n=1 Tax=Tuber borchii TaxID=42251 RepID=A0A2T7A5U2_TUBBO|nr:hypothetical protein B9Z19DRAFT_1119740 [Tuber borchii]